MAQDTNELYNLAAQSMQARGRLPSSASSSRYTDVFNLHWPYVKYIVMAAASWPSCQKTTLPVLSATRTDGSTWAVSDPRPGYKYAYIAPSDMVHPLHLSTYGHFGMGILSNTKCIFTHEKDPAFHYVFDQTDLTKWEPQLFLCGALGLAAFTVQTITGKRSLVRDLQERANAILQEQGYLSGEEQNDPQESVASWHAARGYLGYAEPSRFVFPAGPLIAVGQSANVK